MKPNINLPAEGTSRGTMASRPVTRSTTTSSWRELYAASTCTFIFTPARSNCS